MDGNKTNILQLDFSTGINNTSDNDSETQSLITQGKHIIVINVYNDLINNCSYLNFRTSSHGFKKKLKNSMKDYIDNNLNSLSTEGNVCFMFLL